MFIKILLVTAVASTFSNQLLILNKEQSSVLQPFHQYKVNILETIARIISNNYQYVSV